MTLSTNLNLNLYNRGVDHEQSFQKFRLNLNGPTDSNMTIIDDFAGSVIVSKNEITANTSGSISTINVFTGITSTCLTSIAADILTLSGYFVKIGEQSGSGGYTFSGISQNYKHILVIGMVAGSVTAGTTGSPMMGIAFNSDTGSGNYLTYRWQRGMSGSDSTMDRYFAPHIICSTIQGYSTGSAGYLSPVFVLIPNYSGSTLYKVASSFSTMVAPTSTCIVSSLQGGTWLSASPITSLYMVASTGSATRNFLENSVISVYGIL